MRSRRVLEQFGVPGAITVWMLLVAAVVWRRLPEPLAVHFTLGGSPDGTASPLMLVVPLGGLWLVTWLTLVVVLRTGVDGLTARAVTAAAYLVGGVLASAWATVLTVNAAADTWQAAEITPVALLAPVVVGAVLGAGGWWIASDRRIRQQLRRPAFAVPGGRAEPGSEGAAVPEMVWVGEACNRWLAGAGLGVMAVGVVLALPLWLDALVGLGVVLLVLGGTAGMMSRLVVRVDPTGLRADIGPFGWPRAAVDLADIDRVRVESVRPLAYGGWGYRHLPGVRALIVRGGPAIRLHLRDGVDMVVTVDEADAGAGVLRTILRARRQLGSR